MSSASQFADDWREDPPSDDNKVGNTNAVDETVDPECSDSAVDLGANATKLFGNDDLGGLAAICDAQQEIEKTVEKTAPGKEVNRDTVLQDL